MNLLGGARVQVSLSGESGDHSACELADSRSDRIGVQRHPERILKSPHLTL